MFDFFDDLFHFHSPSTPDTEVPEVPSSKPNEGTWDGFGAWQDATDDFFDGLEDAVDHWGDDAQDFVSGWQQATESFADQFARWFGWDDNTPV